MQPRLILALLLAFSLTVVGCAPKATIINDVNPSEVEELRQTNCKPMTISRGASMSLSKYKDRQGKAAFAVTNDGNMFEYWYCKPGYECSLSSMTQDLYAYCAGISLDSEECRLLYLEDDKLCGDPIQVRETLETKIVPEKDRKALGPKAADGAILYFPGFGGWEWPITQGNFSVPEYVEDLRGDSYDLFQINIPYYNMYGDMLPEIAEEYVRVLKSFKEKGYKKLIITAQSRGAWSAMDSGAIYSDDDVYYILTAPAAHGRKGQSNNLDRADKDLRENVKNSKVKNLVVFYFKDDLYATGNGPDIISDYIGQKDNWHVVAFPTELVGHGAGWTPLFAKTFVSPLKHFLKTNQFSWKNISPEKGVFEDISSPKHLLESDLERVSGQEISGIFTGGKLYSRDTFADDKLRLDFHDSETVTVYLHGDFVKGNSYTTTWAINGDKLAIDFTHRGEFNQEGEIVPLTQLFKVYKNGQRVALLREEDNVIIRRYIK